MVESEVVVKQIRVQLVPHRTVPVLEYHKSPATPVYISPTKRYRYKDNTKLILCDTSLFSHDDREWPVVYSPPRPTHKFAGLGPNCQYFPGCERPVVGDAASWGRVGRAGPISRYGRGMT